MTKCKHEYRLLTDTPMSWKDDGVYFMFYCTKCLEIRRKYFVEESTK